MQVTNKFLEALSTEVAAVMKEYVAKQLDPVLRRIAELEARPEMKYHGTWEQRGYSENSLVTHSGSLWIATQTTSRKPGDGETWRLCCKKGADGKDLR